MTFLKKNKTPPFGRVRLQMLFKSVHCLVYNGFDLLCGQAVLFGQTLICGAVEKSVSQDGAVPFVENPLVNNVL